MKDLGWSMDSSGGSNRIDIFEIYRRFCDIKSGKVYVHGEEVCMQEGEFQKATFSREVLAQLLKLVESRLHTGVTVYNVLSMLMSRLDLMVDNLEFARFYDFVFFFCRENGQKNITVRRAVMAWKLVLAGRFSLLNQWCDFVEKNQRHNITEDTWQQVLAFSWCTREGLQGYDPEGAWPVLIDEFVEHMYRISRPYNTSNFQCSCGDSESQSHTFGEPLPGSKLHAGLKRMLPEQPQEEEMGSVDSVFPQSLGLNTSLKCKRSKTMTFSMTNLEDCLMGSTADICAETTKRNPFSPSKSPCAVEGCLSKGFAELLSRHSYLQLGRERMA